MQASDIAGLKRSGSLARERGASFYDNPSFAQSTWHADILEWHDSACALSAGWLGADAGRTPEISTLMNLPYW